MNLSILINLFHFREHFKILDFQSFLICFLIGWCLLNLVSLSINVVRYNPLRASSFIELPKSIKDKHACINVQNNDDNNISASCGQSLALRRISIRKIIPIALNIIPPSKIRSTWMEFQHLFPYHLSLGSNG